MKWSDLTSGLINYLQQQVSSGDFTTLQPVFSNALPVIVGNAEQRIYRELDFLGTRGLTAVVAQIGNPLLPLPSTVLALESLYLTTGSVPISPASFDFILTAYGAAPIAAPRYFAITGNGNGGQDVVLGPTPDQAYQITAYATSRPAPMSAVNPDTWLGDNLSDLLFAASMVQGAAWMRDYGAQSDDPKLALSWEATYQEHKKSAMEEEERRKGQGPRWQYRAPAPLTGEPRK